MSGNILARRLAGEAAYREGIATEDVERALLSLSRAVRLSPDLPAYRLGFALAIARLDATGFGPPEGIRKLQRTGVLDSLALVLARGGRGAMNAEPFASAWITQGSPIPVALARAAAAPPSSINAALSHQSLHDDSSSKVLLALLNGVFIKEPELLAQLEALRHNFARAALSGQFRSLSDRALVILEGVARQVWIQDGTILSAPDPDLGQRLAGANTDLPFLDLAQRLFYAPGMPWIRSGQYNL